ncbi:hypothetical protein JCM5353_003456 [Sporobolomyces roseus]
MSFFTFALHCLDSIADAINEWFPTSTSPKSRDRQYEALPQRNVLHKRHPYSKISRQITHPIVRFLDQPPSYAEKHRNIPPTPPLATPARRLSIDSLQYTYNHTALTMSNPLKSCFRKASHENQSFGLPSFLPSSTRSSPSSRSSKRPYKEFRFASPIDDSDRLELVPPPLFPKSSKLIRSSAASGPRQYSSIPPPVTDAERPRRRMAPSSMVNYGGRRTSLFTI